MEKKGSVQEALLQFVAVVAVKFTEAHLRKKRRSAFLVVVLQ
jgi:hypothetical protein